MKLMLACQTHLAVEDIVGRLQTAQNLSLALMTDAFGRVAKQATSGRCSRFRAYGMPPCQGQQFATNSDEHHSGRAMQYAVRSTYVRGCMSVKIINYDAVDRIIFILEMNVILDLLASFLSCICRLFCLLASAYHALHLSLLLPSVVFILDILGGLSWCFEPPFISAPPQIFSGEQDWLRE